MAVVTADQTVQPLGDGRVSNGVYWTVEGEKKISRDRYDRAKKRTWIHEPDKRTVGQRIYRQKTPQQTKSERQCRKI